MVSGWKSEREQYLAQVRALSLDKKMLAGKCGVELHEVAQNLVMGHAKSLQGQVQDKIQALQAAANRAVEVFYKDVSTSSSCSCYAIHYGYKAKPCNTLRSVCKLLTCVLCSG
jgi:hypothetical protein